MNARSDRADPGPGEVHYWSRSRQDSAQGATSGYPDPRGLRYTVTADVLLLSIEQRGDVACPLPYSCLLRRLDYSNRHQRQNAERLGASRRPMPASDWRG